MASSVSCGAVPTRDATTRYISSTKGSSMRKLPEGCLTISSIPFASSFGEESSVMSRASGSLAGLRRMCSLAGTGVSRLRSVASSRAAVTSLAVLSSEP